MPSSMLPPPPKLAEARVVMSRPQGDVDNLPQAVQDRRLPAVLTGFIDEPRLGLLSDTRRKNRTDQTEFEL